MDNELINRLMSLAFRAGMLTKDNTEEGRKLFQLELAGFAHTYGCPHLEFASQVLAGDDFYPEEARLAVREVAHQVWVDS